MISYTQEINRKLFHMTSLWIPLLYALLNKATMCIFIAIITFLVITLDIMRHRDAKVARFVAIFSSIIRAHEKTSSDKSRYNLTGASYFMLGSIITIILFTKIIAISAITILVVGDSAAALIGRKFGTRYIGDKTIEGSIAFVISGYIAVFVIGKYGEQNFIFFFSALVAVLCASLAELFAKKIKLDDNIAIPLTFGITMFLLNL